MTNDRQSKTKSVPTGDFLDDWALGLLADPITKLPASLDEFTITRGIVDARVLLKNTYGFNDWFSGQAEFEKWAISGEGHKNEVERHRRVIDYDRPIYEHFKLEGSILDVGGGMGTVREFLSDAVEFISVDPFLYAPFNVPQAKKEAYACLSKKVNFLSGLAEFLPFRKESFDWVHMRSMLDHVQVPDLALIEAHRVLKTDGRLLVGLSVEGGRFGKRTALIFLKDTIKAILGLIGIEKWKDHHTWHPTYERLLKLIADNGFSVEDIYWQPYWNDTVVYVMARKIGYSASRGMNVNIS